LGEWATTLCSIRRPTTYYYIIIGALCAQIFDQLLKEINSTTGQLLHAWNEVRPGYWKQHATFAIVPFVEQRI
jgi:hypothetical protein